MRRKPFEGRLPIRAESEAFDQAGCPPGQKAKLSTRGGRGGKSAGNQFPGKIIAILLADLGNPGLRLGQFLKPADKVGSFLFFHK